MRKLPFLLLSGLRCSSSFLLFRGDSSLVGEDMAGYCMGEDILAIEGEDGMITVPLSPEMDFRRLKLRFRTRFAGVSVAC